MSQKTLVVVAWHNAEQIGKFQSAWKIEIGDPRFVFQRDFAHFGCAATKNLGVEEAVRRGVETVIVLDDDCFPSNSCPTVEALIAGHLEALHPVEVQMFQPVTNPPSRGTPYHCRRQKMPVAASMGFWEHVGDYDACAQLVRGATTPMTFATEPIFGRYFALCGMNLAFRPKDWLPWCQFIYVPRFDDIWMGWLWQKEAYRRGCCFNLNGPMVMHSRQSNVWQNLRDEAKFLEENETLWRDIAESRETEYAPLRKLLPV